jgi:hypothetical protein
MENNHHKDVISDCLMKNDTAHELLRNSLDTCSSEGASFIFLIPGLCRFYQYVVI